MDQTIELSVKMLAVCGGMLLCGGFAAGMAIAAMLAASQDSEAYNRGFANGRAVSNWSPSTPSSEEMHDEVEPPAPIFAGVNRPARRRELTRAYTLGFSNGLKSANKRPSTRPWSRQA
jgi:hypothetical protein